MILNNNDNETVIQVLLDCSATIPNLHKKHAVQNNIAIFERTEPKVIDNIARTIEPEMGLTYTYTV
jgi:hypothetical protein